MPLKKKMLLNHSEIDHVWKFKIMKKKKLKKICKHKTR